MLGNGFVTWMPKCDGYRQMPLPGSAGSEWGYRHAFPETDRTITDFNSKCVALYSTYDATVNSLNNHKMVPVLF